MAYNGAVAWIDDAVARLEAAGYREVPTELGARVSGTMRAMRRSDFRVSWFLTRVHSFILLWEAPVVGVNDIRAFTADAVEWSRQAKGGLPVGLQSGISVFTVAVTGTADQYTIAEARRQRAMSWAIFAHPVLIELDALRAHTYAGNITWGMIYQNFLGQQQANIIGELAGETMKLSTWSGRLRTALAFAFLLVVVVGVPVLLLVGPLLG